MRNQSDFDPSHEYRNFAIAGLQHKYRETVLLYVSEDCHSICKWCFRKRLFVGRALAQDQVVDLDAALKYIHEHSEVRSVLLSGGDCLLAEPQFLRALTSGLEKIRHLHSIRIGTRALVHDPTEYADRIPRITKKRVFVPLHIVRPREVTSELAAVRKRFADYIFQTQTPLLRGINDDPLLLRDLWYRLTAAGILPYYIFQCRPTTGNERFLLTLGEGHRIFATAQSHCTGVAKLGRYVMSTGSGKWEIIGEDRQGIILRCHQGVNPSMVGTIRRVDPNVVWWDIPDCVSRLDQTSSFQLTGNRRPRPGLFRSTNIDPGSYLDDKWPLL